MDHKTKLIKSGEGMGDTSTPACSCGWIGTPEGHWNDWHPTNLHNQTQDHLKEVNNAST